MPLTMERGHFHVKPPAIEVFYQTEQGLLGPARPQMIDDVQQAIDATHVLPTTL